VIVKRRIDARFTGYDLLGHLPQRVRRLLVPGAIWSALPTNGLDAAQVPRRKHTL